MSAQSGQLDVGRIPFYLVNPARALDLAPQGARFGMIKLHGWQVHGLAPVPSDLADQAAYLVRVSYEFDVAPDRPTAEWVEVGFQFPGTETAVYDAVPARVVSQKDAASYTLTGQLNFTLRNGGEVVWPPSSPAASIPMPALTPRIDQFGASGSSVIKWRHTGQVPPGAHVGWLVLLVPMPWDEVQVVAMGNYHVEVPEVGVSPWGQPDAFTIRLPAIPRADAPIRAVARTPVARSTGPRVFVSYAWESDAHMATVRKLCEFLRTRGVDVRFDKQDTHLRRNWEEWTTVEIRNADYVIVIASPDYQAVGDGTLADTERRGLRSEYLRLIDLQHRFRDEWTRKILPVVLPGRSPGEIPLSFQPFTSDHYRLTSITDDGAASLLGVLLHDTRSSAD